MTPEQSKHFGATFSYEAKPALSDGARIYDYEGEDNIPAPLKSPLSAAELAPFLDQDRLITFTVRVPLGILTAGGEELYEHIVSMAFDEPVVLSSFELRAVGASFGRFDEKFCGDVHVQVTGDLTTPG